MPPPGFLSEGSKGLPGLPAPGFLESNSSSDAPWWGKAASGYLEGVAQLGEFVQQVQPGNPKLFGLNPLNRDPSAGDAIRSMFDTVTGVEGSTDIGKGGGIHTAASYVPNFVLGPEKVATNIGQTLLTSALAGGGREIGGDVGELAGLATSVLAPVGANKIAGTLDDVGAALGRKSLGASYSDYLKTADDLQRIDLPEGDLSSLTKKTLDELVSQGSLGSSRDPAKLAAVARENEAYLGKQIGNEIRDFEIRWPSKVTPTFERAKNFLATGKVPADQIDRYAKRLDAIEEGIKANGDGSLSFLQQQKIALGNAFDGGDTVLNKFNRALYQDLQKTIEGVVPSVAGLNQELSKWKLVSPIFTRALARSEASDVYSKAVNLWKTTGGFGVPILLAGSTAGAPAAAAAAGASLLTTPQGQRVSGSVSQLMGSVFSKASPVPSAVALGSQLTQSDQAERKSDQAQSQLQKEVPQSSPKPSAISDIFQRQPEGIMSQVFSKVNSALSVPKELVDAVIKQESSGRKDAVSEKGATGLMQVMPATAKEIAKELGVEKYDLKDPDTNKLFGSYYLSKLMNQFGDLALALTAYHSGPGRVARLLRETGGTTLEDILPRLGPVGQKYAKEVMAKIEDGKKVA